MAASARSARSSSPPKYSHHRHALSARPRAATAASEPSTGRCDAAMPMAITDSPIATITTRPWRSTKCAGAIAKPRLPLMTGVIHSKTPANVDRTSGRDVRPRNVVPVRDLPAGTVTFLFTDVEGSTRLLHELGDGYAPLLAAHRRTLRAAFLAHRGVEVDTQ